MKKSSGQDKKNKQFKKEKQNINQQPDKKDRKVFIAKKDDDVPSSEIKEKINSPIQKIEPQPFKLELENNWKYYADIPNDVEESEGTDFKKLLESSNEYIKYKLPENKSDLNEPKFVGNILNLDLNKLDNLIRCESFHKNFLSNLNQSDYFDEAVIQSFESKAKEAREEMDQLRELKETILTSDLDKNVKTKSETEAKSKEIEKPVETLPTSSKSLAIEDWLDELIID